MHTAYLFFLRRKFEAALDQRTAAYSISYEDISMSPKLFGWEVSVSNLRVLLYGNKHIAETVVFKKILIRNLLFSKKLLITIVEGTTLETNNADAVPNNEGSVFDIDFVDNVITMTLAKKWKSISKLDMKVNRIKIGYKTEDTLGLDNFSLNTVSSQTKNHGNFLIKMNIDAIKFREKTDKSSEANLEFAIRGDSELGSDGRIIAVNIKVENFLLNNVSGNFGFSVVGNLALSQITEMILVDGELKIINFNSFLASAETEGGGFSFLNRTAMSNLIQIINIIPENQKNTDSEKYYRFIWNLTSKKIIINDVDSVEIFKKFIPTVEDNKAGESI
jgi:hypothetical protein